jgi:hypothetical protein
MYDFRIMIDTRGTILTILMTSLFLSQSQRCYGLDAILEHSIDGKTFHKAAMVDTTSAKQSNVLPLESPQDYMAAVESLVGSTTPGGYYYMRLKSSFQEGFALASIPLECWIKAGSQARIELHLHGRKTDEVASISLVAPCPPSSLHTKTVLIDSCTVVRPRVVVAPALPQQTDRILEPIDEQQQEGNHAALEGQRNTTKTTQDDRTWLQKNWLFVGLAFFIIANKLGSAADAAHRQQAQGSR